LQVDGNKVVYGCRYGNTYLCSLQEQTKKRVLRTFRDDSQIWWLQYDDQRDLLVTSNEHKFITKWSMETGKCVQKFTGHDRAVFNFQFVNNVLATASFDGTVRLWDLSTGQTVRTFAGHSAPVSTVRFCGDDKLISGSDDSTLKIWDIPSGRCAHTLQNHGQANWVEIHAPTQRMLSVSQAKVNVWKLGGPDGADLMHTIDCYAKSSSYTEMAWSLAVDESRFWSNCGALHETSFDCN